MLVNSRPANITLFQNAAVEEELIIFVRNTTQAIIADGGKDVSYNKLMVDLQTEKRSNCQTLRIRNE